MVHNPPATLVIKKSSPYLSTASYIETYLKFGLVHISLIARYVCITYKIMATQVWGSAWCTRITKKVIFKYILIKSFITHFTHQISCHITLSRVHSITVLGFPSVRCGQQLGGATSCTQRISMT